MKNWKETKIDLLTGLYGATAARFEEEKEEDDKAAFVSIYKALLEAVRSLPNEPVALVRVAMNRMIGDGCGKLDRIKERFEKGRKNHDRD